MLTIVFAFAVFAADPAAASDEDYFEREIRPLLIERCQKCHGSVKQNGSLRLDSRSAMMKGGDSGPALAPDDLKQSLILKAVRREGDVSPMPPNEPLSPADMEKITRWIERGAPWPDSKPAADPAKEITQAAEKHWAFQPIKDHNPPEVALKSWPIGNLDRFVLSNLEARKIQPAKEADRTTLIRRATFDLIGLPPTPEEVDAFVADPEPTPAAFARVVERLLASPHYGERWGRHWLDVARYADTKGYVFQEERRYPYAYTYRDWVIDAFNRDMPFDDFVVAQIAADHLPHTKKDSTDLAAMGFLTVGRRFLQDIQEITDDRIDVVTRGFMGLTVSCSRCHDHKYDPIPAEDYYSLYGIFMSSEEPKDLPVLESSGVSAAREDFKKQLGKRESTVAKYLEEQHRVIEARMRTDAEKWLSIAIAVDHKPNDRKIGELCKQRGIPQGGFRQWLARWNSELGKARAKHDPVLSIWASLTALPEKDFTKVASDRIKKYSSDSKKPIAPALAAELSKPIAKREDLARIFGSIIARSVKEKELATQLGVVVADGGPFSVPKTETQRFFDRKQREKFKGLEREVEALKAKHPGAEARAMVMVDRQQLFNPRVLVRGNPGRPGKQVPRQFLALLDGKDRKPFQKGSGRLELAESIVREDNPLTARVIVNRVWAWHFGKGLAPSLSDFGLRSDPPTYPELLDHLAAQFVAEGWSIKSLHRAIMNSRTYQQASAVSPEAISLDPDNTYYSRFPRQRLDWESLRDALLAVAGRLDAAVGGRPVPLFEGQGATRRTLYGFIDRQNLDPSYRVFDFASPDATSPRRFVTIVPQQSLFLMNHPFVAAQAESFANRATAAEPSNGAARIAYLYRHAFSRRPTEKETELALAFVKNAGERAWPKLVHALLMTNEFASID